MPGPGLKRGTAFNPLRRLLSGGLVALRKIARTTKRIVVLRQAVVLHELVSFFPRPKRCVACMSALSTPTLKSAMGARIEAIHASSANVCAECDRHIRSLHVTHCTSQAAACQKLRLRPGKASPAAPI